MSLWIKLSFIFVDIVFCPALIYAPKWRQKNSEKLKKGTKIQVPKPKRVKNKYNMIGWWIKGSQHLKTLFIEIEAKTLIKRGQKVDFLIQPFNQVEFWIVS